MQPEPASAAVVGISSVPITLGTEHDAKHALVVAVDKEKADEETYGGTQQSQVRGQGQLGSAPPPAPQQDQWILYALSFLCASTASGMVYGWPALRRSLIEEDGFSLTETQLGIAYTAGSWSANAGRFASGMIRDAIGTRYTIIICLSMVIIGSIIVALVSGSTTSVVSLTIGMFCMGLGTGVLLCVQPVCALFPNYSSTAMASLSGAFQMSGMIFMILAAVGYRKHAYLGYAVYVSLLAVVCMFMLPVTADFRARHDSNSYSNVSNVNDENKYQEAPRNDTDNDDGNGKSTERKSIAQRVDIYINTYTDGDEENIDNNRDSYKKRGSDEEADAFSAKEARKFSITVNDVVQQKRASMGITRFRTISRTEGLKNGHDKWDQLFSTEYRALLLWFCCCMPATQFYIMSIGFQLELWGDSKGIYSNVFIWAQGSVALIFPFTGRLADILGLGFMQGMATSLLAMSFAILALPKDIGIEVQVVGIWFYSAGRGIFFGLFFSNIGRRFGYTNFGLLAGFGLLLAAISSLLQYPLLWWCVAGGDIATNITCFLSLVATIPYAIWLRKREKSVPTMTDIDCAEGKAEDCKLDDDKDKITDRDRARAGIEEEREDNVNIAKL